MSSSNLLELLMLAKLLGGGDGLSQLLEASGNYAVAPSEWIDAAKEYKETKDADKVVQDIKDGKIPLSVERKNNSGENMSPHFLFCVVVKKGWLDLFVRILPVLPEGPVIVRGLHMTQLLARKPVRYPFLVEWLKFCKASRPDLLQLDYYDDSNPPTLNIAARHKNAAAMKLLLQYGASPTILNCYNVDNNRGVELNALSVCAVIGYVAGMEVIVNHTGTNANDFVNSGGYTPLHYAVKHNEPDSVIYLLCNGADLNKKALDGKSAADILSSCDSEKLKKFVKKWQRTSQ